MDKMKIQITSDIFHPIPSHLIPKNNMWNGECEYRPLKKGDIFWYFKLSRWSGYIGPTKNVSTTDYYIVAIFESIK
jgi:hypothetical protein